MSRKAGIIISFLLALLFTMLVTLGANAKYRQVSKGVTVVRAAQFIPAGAEIKPEMVETASVPAQAAIGMATSVDEVAGKVAAVSMVKDQYVWKEAVKEGKGLKDGYVVVYVPVDLSSSAAVVAGDVVDVFAVEKSSAGTSTKLLAQGVRVLHSLNQDGSEIEPGKGGGVSPVPASRAPASVGLEVPKEVASQVVQYASAKAVYLARSAVPGA
ncbi:transcription elongation factor [Moorella thermoacetica Y72]|uniref:Transcription elongation factor n=1 Tax=Moorella thermoacetica Y72 TaxID=1325331 RepID=A0A0S6UAN7_NEOTH|nr:SAF domain-containing protein [Moorella thermoacetica]GAF24702.1 transcription elongation factor [Moorella thermoacetica Y72]